MSTFYLKKNDLRPIFEVVLKNPNKTVHDLTGSTSWKLHIKQSNGLLVTRDLVIEGLPTAGTLRYTWVATDWTTPPTLIVGNHQMEYEIIAGAVRQTFPNGEYDVLQIITDLGTG